MSATIPYGVRQAVASEPLPVDLSAITFDPSQQVSVVRGDGTVLPALKHSTGQTSTNTAVQDNMGSADSDVDQTED